MTDNEEIPLSKWLVHDHNESVTRMRDFHQEAWCDIVKFCKNFSIPRLLIEKEGGSKSPITKSIENEFLLMGWREKPYPYDFAFGDNTEKQYEKIDFFKIGVAVKIEWNNKDAFFDRDISTFKIFHEKDEMQVGVFITRASEMTTSLQTIRPGSVFGSASTHTDKLLLRLNSGKVAALPVLVLGMRSSLIQ
jgi:hypothetical protein